MLHGLFWLNFKFNNFLNLQFLSTVVGCTRNMSDSTPEPVCGDDIKFAQLVLRKAKTDSEKLAALLLVGRRFANVNLKENVKAQLLDLIDIDFIYRLLTDLYENLILHDAIDVLKEKDFVLKIVNQFFSSIISNCANPIIFVELLGKILHRLFDHSDISSELDAVSDILDCFSFINNAVEHDHLFECNSLISIYSDHILTCYLRENQSGFSKILALLTDFSKRLTSENFNAFLNKLSSLFCENHSYEKFKICDLISHILQSTTFEKKEDFTRQEWNIRVRDTLFEIFKNRLSGQMRKSCIHLATELTLLFNGLDWIKLDQWQEDNTKFFELLLKLVSIEIELSLTDLFNRSLVNSDEYVRYMLLYEHLLLTLVNDCDDANNSSPKLSNESLLGAIESINSTMGKVVYSISQLSREFDQAKLETYQMIVASIRLVSLYVLEESEALRKEIADIIPFMLQLLHKDNRQEVQLVKPQIEAAIETLYQDTEMKSIIDQHESLFR